MSACEIETEPNRHTVSCAGNVAVVVIVAAITVFVVAAIAAGAVGVLVHLNDFLRFPDLSRRGKYSRAIQ